MAGSHFYFSPPSTNVSFQNALEIIKLLLLPLLSFPLFSEGKSTVCVCAHARYIQFSFRRKAAQNATEDG